VGVPIAELVAWLVLLVALTFVVVLSRRGVAIVTILLGLAAAAASGGLYPETVSSPPLLSEGNGHRSPRAC
jgi:hypothetical protein